MSDVKVELKETVSRDDAETWLSTLAEAFGGDGHVELPLGPSVVSVHVPDRIRAEIEVEVDGDEVEVEVEFKWSTAKPADDSPAEPLASPRMTAQHASARKPARGSRRLTAGAPFTNLMGQSRDPPCLSTGRSRSQGGRLRCQT